MKFNDDYQPNGERGSGIMRRGRTGSHPIKENWLILLVALLLCGLLFLFITSIGKQLESKQSKLEAETARLEMNLVNVYFPFNYIAAQLQSCYASGDEFDSGIIQAVEYNREAKLSYLSQETAGFGGAFAYAKNLAFTPDAIKREIVRVLNIVPAYNEATAQKYFFISHYGFSVYFNPVPIDDLLDENGTYNTVAAFSQDLFQNAELWFDGDTDYRLIGPYADPVTGEMIITHLRPVTAGGELMGVTGCNISLEDMTLFLGGVCSNLGQVYLVADNGQVLAGYSGGTPLYGGQIPGETLNGLLEPLGVTPEEYAAGQADAGQLLWRGWRGVIIRSVQGGEYTVIYVMSLLQFIAESNLLLWFLLCVITLAFTAMLLFSLIRSKRELVSSNVVLHESVEKLDYLSRFDGLTGLMKGETIIEKLEQFSDRDDVVVCMMDVDHFKQINDHYLHTFGNVVLKRIASVIQQHMPDGACAGRFGGDEFLCLFTNMAPQDVCQVAEAIRRDVEAFRFREHDIKVTLSVGIAVGTGRPDANVLEVADQRLYRAKQNGRNQCLYEEG